MAAEAGSWCVIESDPGLFTELLAEFGCKGVVLEELWSLDEEAFKQLDPVFGLIFLFPYKQKPGEMPEGTVLSDARSADIFFAQQVIQNACATQAILNCVMNVKDPTVCLGPTLEDFRLFTAGFDSASVGLCLSNSEIIRNVHNSFARQQIFDGEVSKGSAKEDVFHFVTYIPHRGRIYELDGLQEGPIDLGPIAAPGDWLASVRPVIAARMERYADGEIHFNLMAVVADRKLRYQKRLDELMASPNLSSSEEVEQLHNQIQTEELKWQAQKAENIRRRHNYLPFIVELIKLLAREGKLVPLIKEAKAKVAE